MTQTLTRPIKRAPRFSSDLHILIKTFGCRNCYDLVVANVSQSGILLSAKKNSLPFMVSTIVEVIIDPNGSYFRKPMHCIGKVTRIETLVQDGEEAVPDGYIKMGICITDIDENHQIIWNDYIDSLSQKSNQFEEFHQASVERMIENTTLTKQVING